MTELVLFIVFAGHISGAAILPALLGRKLMLEMLRGPLRDGTQPASALPVQQRGSRRREAVTQGRRRRKRSMGTRSVTISERIAAASPSQVSAAPASGAGA